MKTKLLLCFASLLFPLIGMAEFKSAYPWRVEDQEAHTWHTENAVTTHVTTNINYSQDGSKNIYFSLADYDLANDRTSGKNYCDPAGFNNRGVITLNGQAIKVIMWCKKFSDGSNHYLEVTALTNQGSSYIVNQFSRAPESVELGIDGKRITISAKGFLASWGKSTDRAL